LNFSWLLVGLILAVIFAVLAQRLGWLSAGGALAAAGVGAVTFGFGGLLPAALLILFFLSSNLLSRFWYRRKLGYMVILAKGGPRDAVQVLANGALPAALALLYGVYHVEILLAGIAGSLAASTADTWGTEIGLLVPRSPKLITTWRDVPAGTSGGVTLEGGLASVLGAGLIAVCPAWYLSDAGVLVAVWMGGALGSLADSVLGATVQAVYFCPRCDRATERSPLHTCGARTTFMRGWRWFNNDAVNFAAALLGAVATMLFMWLV
jgi:uncharacterized protein (TIGR00297 family)